MYEELIKALQAAHRNGSLVTMLDLGAQAAAALEAQAAQLAAYEKTGLEPEEIMTGLELANFYAAMLKLKQYEAIGTVEHLTELCKAESDGRLMVLPCKVGQIVKVDARTWGESWNYKTTENGRFLVGEIVSIIKTKTQLLMKVRVEHNIGWKRPMKRYPLSAIGKTVFLSRAEAEAALGGGEREGD